MFDLLIGLGTLLFILFCALAPSYVVVETFNRWNAANVRRQREAALMEEGESHV